MPAAPDGSTTSPARLINRRMAASISSSLTSITSSTVPAMMPTASGTGTRTAMPSAMDVLDAATGLCARHESAIEGAVSAQTAIAGEAVEEEVGAAAFEAADRVDRFDLQHYRHAELVAQRLAHVLGRVEEDGIDHGRGLADAVDGDRSIHELGTLKQSRSK